MTTYDELIEAIESTQQKKLEEIVAQDSSIINYSGSNDSPLHYAVAAMAGLDEKDLQPALDIVLALISLGANPLKENADKITPLAYAEVILDKSPSAFSQILDHCENVILDFQSPFENKLFKHPTALSKSSTEPLVKEGTQSRE